MPALRPAALLAAFLMAACAVPVREQALREPESIATLQARNFVDDKLRGEIQVGEIKGTDPDALGYLQQTLDRVWRSRATQKTVGDALEEQLHELRLLASAARPGRYVLDVEILSLGSGGLPLSSEGEAEVRYRLREAQGNRVIYERRLRSTGDVPMGLLWPPLRQRAAKESALRANLAKLGQDLVRLRV